MRVEQLVYLEMLAFDRQQSNLDKLRQVLGLLMDWMYLEYYVEDTDDLLSYDKVVFEDLWRLKIEEIW